MSRRDERIDRDPAVQRLAARFGFAEQTELARRIVARVEQDVAAKLDAFEAGSSPSLGDLRDVVLDTTSMRVVRIDTDAQLADAVEQHAGRIPLLKQLEFEFDQSTEALVVKSPDSEHTSRGGPRFTAFVDARGAKAPRAWFSEWHETSHLLVPDDSDSIVYRRTSVERPEPLEQVIDAVAARVAFWPNSVKPLLLSQLAHRTCVLEAFEAARLAWAPESSREASYRAFAQHVGRPIVLLRARMESRKEDARAGHFAALSSLALRAVCVIQSPEAMGTSLYIPKNYRVPSESIISAWSGELPTRAVEALENLRTWGDSSGRRLRDLRVRITVAHGWASVEVA